MSEDDRAAKAARAKAMLKKRQQKKADTSAASVTGASSPQSIESPKVRALSPPPSEPPAPTFNEPQRDISDIFSNAHSQKDDWLSSLPRAEPAPSTPISSPVPPTANSPSQFTPSAPTATHSSSPPQDFSAELRVQIASQQATIEALTSDKRELSQSLDQLKNVEKDFQELRSRLDVELAIQAKWKKESESHHSTLKSLQSSHEETSAALAKAEKTGQEMQIELDNQQQTISLLVSEKSSLAATLERLHDTEAKYQEQQRTLEAEQKRLHELHERHMRLQDELSSKTQRLIELEAREKSLSDQCRDQERDLLQSQEAASDLREVVEQHRRKLKELEADDRVERLEASLKNTQDRADELDFQLSKLKKSHADIKSEHEASAIELQSRTRSESEWKQKHTGLEKQHTALRTQLGETKSSHESLKQELASLKSQQTGSQKQHSELQHQLTEAATALTFSGRRLEEAQTELRHANRRAEDAEQTQADLQVEGTRLMAALDEMRPKIVELTDAKMDLTVKVDGLERGLRERDETIEQLEDLMDETRAAKDAAHEELSDVRAERESERAQTKEQIVELQKACAGLQTELDELRPALKALEAERTGRQHLVTKHKEETARLQASLQTAEEAALALQKEVEQRRGAQDEGGEFVERLRAEVEGLRGELAARDDELVEARADASTSGVGGEEKSLDEELLQSERALDISGANSRIRDLESKLFEAEAETHALQKRIRLLEDDFARDRRVEASAISRGASPASRSVATRNKAQSPPTSGLRSTSNLELPQNLSAATRHKRRVSLGMLKARLDGEARPTLQPPHPLTRSTSPALNGHQPTNQLPTLMELVPEALKATSQSDAHGRRFVDEAHVFWCAACKGDLVIL